MFRLIKKIRKIRSSLIEQNLVKKAEKETEKIDFLIQKLNQKQCKTDLPIKVGFIVQLPEIWDKEAPVFERMLISQQFDPWLIVVPAYNTASKKFEKYSSELDYFKKTYPTAHILTSAELSNSFTKLKNYYFDYIFYQRCWELYLPKALNTNQVIKYAKTCYIPYEYHNFQNSKTYYKTRFFSNLYILFSCNKQQNDTYSPPGERKSVFLGCPSLSKITYTTRDFSRLRILWTPRWETNPRYGGTSFFDYKDRWIPYKQAHPEDEIIFRPHPLTFEQAVSTKQMTNKEVDEYKRRIKEAGIHFDSNARVDITLDNINIMVTDYTSVIINAFLKGVVLIHCSKSPLIAPNEILQSIINCSYHAQNWNEVEKLLDQLRNGNDPLREKREKLANALNDKNTDSDLAVLEFLINDMQQNK